MELFTFALVIWVIYLGLALWPESEKSHRGENEAKELGEKATATTVWKSAGRRSSTREEGSRERPVPARGQAERPRMSCPGGHVVARRLRSA
jgi:hypothetical protein